MLLLGSVFAQSPGPKALFDKALSSQQRGDFAAAVEQYRKVVQITPDVLPAWINMGVALVQLGKFNEAIESYHSALALDPKNKQVRFYLALAHYKSGDMAGAAKELELLSKADPNEVGVATLLADCYLRLGDSNRALAITAPLAAKSVENLDFAWVYGTALISNGKLKEGADLVERVAKGGNSADAYLLAGQTLLRLNLSERARDDLDAAARLNPNLPTVFTKLGTARERNADYKGAVEAYRKGIEQNPQDLEALLGLGGVLYFERDLPAAKAALDQALRIDPSSVSAKYAMALVKKASGDLAAAATDLEAVVKANPNWIQAHVELAAVYFRLHRNEDGARERKIVDKLSDEERKAGPQ